MSDFYIVPEWLAAVRGKTLFYPAAGLDYLEPLTVLQDYVGTFWFCDIGYRERDFRESVFASNCNFRRAESSTVRRMDERNREHPKLCELIGTYERADGRKITVIRQRGFGQLVLSTEFTERSVGVFMHRRDSQGEGGSNVYFLANKKSDFEPCSNLFDKLACCLTDQALIISDGSNTEIRQLMRFQWDKNVRGSDAFRDHKDRPFAFEGFLWTCVGWLSQRNGPTIVWGVSRLAKPAVSS